MYTTSNKCDILTFLIRILNLISIVYIFDTVTQLTRKGTAKNIIKTFHFLFRNLKF